VRHKGDTLAHVLGSNPQTWRSEGLYLALG
jgi:hypothetical protein